MRQFEHIEAMLEKGTRLGFRKPTSDDLYTGWIILYKVAPHQITTRTGALDPVADGHIIEKHQANELYIRLHPYTVLLLELRRDVHERGDYETNSDYRLKE